MDTLTTWSVATTARTRGSPCGRPAGGTFTYLRDSMGTSDSPA